MSRKATDIAKATEVILAALDACQLGDDSLRVTIEVVPESQPMTKADATIGKALSRAMPILKTQEERYVLAVVLEPLKEMGMTDSQDDTYSAAEVRQACHKYMEDYGGTLGLQHKVNVSGKVKIVENHITRMDEVIDGEPVRAGTWLMGLRVVDDGLWKRVKDGTLTGLSIGGIAQRTPLEPPQN